MWGLSPPHRATGRGLRRRAACVLALLARDGSGPGRPQYLVLCGPPLSIRKMVTNYLRLQQAGHYEMRTLVFIAKLPVQVLPTTVGRNPLIFGPGLSTIVDWNPLIFGPGFSNDCCVYVAVSSASFASSVARY